MQEKLCSLSGGSAKQVKYGVTLAAPTFKAQLSDPSGAAVRLRTPERSGLNANTRLSRLATSCVFPLSLRAASVVCIAFSTLTKSRA